MGEKKREAGCSRENIGHSEGRRIALASRAATGALKISRPVAVVHEIPVVAKGVAFAIARWRCFAHFCVVHTLWIGFQLRVLIFSEVNHDIPSPPLFTGCGTVTHILPFEKPTDFSRGR